MTEHMDAARDNWERLADAEQLQKAILFYKDEEQAAPAAANPAGAQHRAAEPWCSPYVPGPGASTGKSGHPHDLRSPGGALVRSLYTP